MNEDQIPQPAPTTGNFPPQRTNSLPLLVRLLFYVAIIGLAIAFLLPSVRSSREASRRNGCLNNLKQISIALSNYESEHGAYPPAYTVDADGKPLHSWRTLILPYMEQTALFKRIDLSKPWNDPANKVAYDTMPYAYGCPSAPAAGDKGHNLTNYLAVVTPDSVIRRSDSLSHAELRAPAMNMLVIDVGPKHATHWMSPVDADEKLLLSLSPGSELPHAGNIYLAAFADGHGAAISTDCDPTVLRAQITASADDDHAFSDDN